MRVLMLAWEYPPNMVGGMGRHVAELAPALAQRGIEVHVVTPQVRGGPEQEQHGTLWVHRVPLPDHAIQDYLAHVARVNDVLVQCANELHAQEPFQLIHVHDWLTAHAGIALKHAWHRPLLATIHATERGRGRGALPTAQAAAIDQVEWTLSYESWRVIACSGFMAGQLCGAFAVPADKIDVIPNGITVGADPLPTERQRRAYRRRFATAQQPIGLYVGRLVREKGVHVLLDAWRSVLAAFPQARLLVAGVGSEQDALRATADALGIAQNVTFLGFISDDERDKLYRIADVAAFPSLYEPFGIVALEAMAAGCPVVVAESGGLAEVVRLHETGLLVYPENSDSLAWGVVHTLRHPAWSRRRASAALREVQQNYSWPTIAASTAAVYTRVQLLWAQSTWGDA